MSYICKALPGHTYHRVARPEEMPTGFPSNPGESRWCTGQALGGGDGGRGVGGSVSPLLIDRPWGEGKREPHVSHLSTGKMVVSFVSSGSEHVQQVSGEGDERPCWTLGVQCSRGVDLDPRGGIQRGRAT